MAEMFRKCVDQNGVEISGNSHPVTDYGHSANEQRPSQPHWMAGYDGFGGYTEPPAETIVHKTKDRVIGGQRSRAGAMIFEGDLLPRSERVPREEAGRPIEKHDPSCWCDLCHPPQPPTEPVKAYRR